MLYQKNIYIHLYTRRHERTIKIFIFKKQFNVVLAARRKKKSEKIFLFVQKKREKYKQVPTIKSKTIDQQPRGVSGEQKQQPTITPTIYNIQIYPI